MPIASKETFEKASTDVKLDLLYDCSEAIYVKLAKLENRKRTDKALSFTGGVIGGIVAVVMKGVFWK